MSRLSAPTARGLRPRIRRYLRAAAALAAVAAASCSSMNARVADGADLGPQQRFHVVPHERDKHGIADHLRGELAASGRLATVGAREAAPPETTVVVYFEDRWQWDMTMYLRQLTVIFRDAASDRVLAEAQSVRNSMSRRSPARMAADTVRAVLEKAHPVEAPPEQAPEP